MGNCPIKYSIKKIAKNINAGTSAKGIYILKTDDTTERIVVQ